MSVYTGFEQVILRQSPTAPPSTAERIEQRKRDYAAYQRRRRAADTAADVERRAYWRHEAGLDGNGHGARTWWHPKQHPTERTP